MTTVCYNENEAESLRGEIARLRGIHEDMRSRWEVERRALQKQIPSPRLPRASERIDEYRLKQMRAEVEKAYRRLHALRNDCERLLHDWDQRAYKAMGIMPDVQYAVGQCIEDLRGALEKL